MKTPEITALREGGRIGVVADTHCESAGRRLPDSLIEAFAGVDLILHLGDCGDPGALDDLARLAPVLATRGADDRPADPRYADARVILAAALSIGALFDLGRAGVDVVDGKLGVVPKEVAAVVASAFGRPIDCVLFAATHAPLVAHAGGTLFVNPGSATLPARPGPGTAAIIETTGAVIGVEIVRL